MKCIGVIRMKRQDSTIISARVRYIKCIKLDIPRDQRLYTKTSQSVSYIKIRDKVKRQTSITTTLYIAYNSEGDELIMSSEIKLTGTSVY